MDDVNPNVEKKGKRKRVRTTDENTEEDEKYIPKSSSRRAKKVVDENTEEDEKYVPRSSSRRAKKLVKLEDSDSD